MSNVTIFADDDHERGEAAARKLAELNKLFVPRAGADAQSPRASLLDEAKALVTGDRNNTYGPPTQDFERSANALDAMGYRGPDGRHLMAHDVAIMVSMVKLSRLMWTPTKRDSWTDIAGYAACGYECAVTETEPA